MRGHGVGSSEASTTAAGGRGMLQFGPASSHQQVSLRQPWSQLENSIDDRSNVELKASSIGLVVGNGFVNVGKRLRGKAARFREEQGVIEVKSLREDHTMLGTHCDHGAAL